MNTSNEEVQFNEWKCFLSLGYYSNKRLAIELVSAEDNPDKDLYLGEPIAIATVNVPEAILNPNEIIIKNYSENEGILECLQKAGYISNSVKKISTGFVTCHVVEKTDKLLELENSFKVSNKLKM